MGFQYDRRDGNPAFINAHLARACKDFGMGMGLGSCRALLYSDEYMKDFDIRHLIGDDQPLFANLGIAQVELLLEKKKQIASAGSSVRCAPTA